MALACDLTRVATIVTQDIPGNEFGVAPGVDIHQDIAHASEEDGVGLPKVSKAWSTTTVSTQSILRTCSTSWTRFRKVTARSSTTPPWCG